MQGQAEGKVPRRGFVLFSGSVAVCVWSVCSVTCHGYKKVWSHGKVTATLRLRFPQLIPAGWVARLHVTTALIMFLLLPVVSALSAALYNTICCLMDAFMQRSTFVEPHRQNM